MPITLTKRTLAIGLLSLALAVSPTLSFAQAQPDNGVVLRNNPFKDCPVDAVWCGPPPPEPAPQPTSRPLPTPHPGSSHPFRDCPVDAVWCGPPPAPRPTFRPTPTPLPTFRPVPPLPQPCPWWQWWCDPVPPTTHYVALGDSVAVGLTSIYGYVYHYRDFLQSSTGRAVNVTNLGQAAWSSSDLLQALRTDARFRQAVAQAHYVTWNIGGKDLLDARERYQAQTCGGGDNQQCLRETSAQLRANWSGIVNEVVRLRGGSVATVQTMDIYNPFVSVDIARDSWPNDAGTDWHVLQTHLNVINTHFFIAAREAGIRLAPVFAEFNGPEGTEDPRQKGYISFDGFHPNNLGHAVIGQLLAH